MDLASVVAALASVGVRVSGSTPNSNVQVDSSRACPTGLAGPEPSGTINDPGQHFHHCGSDCGSRHPVRLVWVNGSFGCRTIAARTRDLILDTILAVTNSYSTVPVLLWDLGSLTCESA